MLRPTELKSRVGAIFQFWPFLSKNESKIEEMRSFYVSEAYWAKIEGRRDFSILTISLEEWVENWKNALILRVWGLLS